MSISNVTSQAPPTHSFPATDAAAIARMFHDDGRTLRANGVGLASACKALGATTTREYGGVTRFRFQDGSTITAGSKTWSVGGAS